MKQDKFTKSLLMALPLLMLVAAPVVADSTKADKAAYEAALAAANEAADKAASVGGEWRDTRWKKSSFVKWTSPAGETVKGSYMGVAAKAAEAGDYNKALELLETAKFQSEMGYTQAMEQKNAGPKLN